ncbi:MAG: hypothetical protein WC668_02745 [Patescibacteria group bacterium]
MVIQCCVCSKVRSAGTWEVRSIPPGEQVSHGYCPECAEKVFQGIERELAARQKKEETVNG